MVSADFDITKVSSVKQKKNYNFALLPQNTVRLFLTELSGSWN
jgi:hypothetical protein